MGRTTPLAVGRKVGGWDRGYDGSRGGEGAVHRFGKKWLPGATPAFRLRVGRESRGWFSTLQTGFRRVIE
jgi:hypothetical protein